MSLRPNLFIVGAPKCGTTSLHDFLVQQQGFAEGIHKEPHYFNEDHPEFRHATEMDQYLSFFKSVSDERNHYVLDSSTHYLYSEKALSGIMQFENGARIVVMLRNPVDLVRSMHQHLLFRQIETEQDLAQAWNLGPVRERAPDFVKQHPYPGHVEYREIGKLGHHLQKVINVVPEKQLLILFLDELKQDTAGLMAKLNAFLDVELDDSVSFSARNQAKSTRSPLLNRLLFYPGPVVSKVKKTIKSVVPRNFVRKLDLFSRIGNTSIDRSLNVELRTEMQEYFREDMELISRLTDRNLDHWLIENKS